MRVLGWMTEAASKYGIVFHLLPWLPKQGRYWQKEKEIKLGRQWVLGECLKVREDPRMRVERGQPREETRLWGTCPHPGVCEQWALSPLHTSTTQVPESPLRSTLPQNTQRWDTGSLVLLGGRQNEGSLCQVPRVYPHSGWQVRRIA